ncbi:hypothetical protein FO519_000100 [Halicephalobus sp. NKZ332]|nr:hypothetical protein FO519_000100 [Halicephalobus sp. NKZ332]
MAYLGSFSTNPNITAKFPCSTYGDLQFKKGPHGGKSVLSVQYNLAEFSRRPGLVPVVAGFPIPALHTGSFGIEGVFQRNDFEEKIPRRNLLCSELLDPVHKGVRLFSVADKSDRKQLIEAEIEFNTLPTDEVECGLVKLKKSLSNAITVKLDHEAIELRKFEGSVENTRRIFIRRKNGLDFFNADEQKFYGLFNEDIIDFYQVPGLNDEIVLLDTEKRIWYGRIGRSLSRKKSSFEPSNIAPTTCPRTVLVGNDNELKILDLRDNRPEPNSIFELPSDLSNYPSDSFVQIAVKIFDKAKEKILHISSVPGRSYAAVCSTNFYHYLIDQRVPGEAVLVTPHSVLQDDAHCFVSPKLKDSLTGNYVHNFFSLSHMDESHVGYWPLYIDVKENLWSSVSSLKFLPSHDSIEKYCYMDKDWKRSDFDPEILPKKTKAVCFQEIPLGNSVNPTALIFQQMEDGSVWYTNFVMDPVSKDPIDQRPLRKTAFKLLKNYYVHGDSADLFTKGLLKENLSEKFQQDRKKHINVINAINPELTLPNMVDILKPPNDYDPIGNLRKSKDNGIRKEDFQPMEEVNEKDVFANIILNSWKNSGTAFRNYFFEKQKETCNDPRRAVQGEPKALCGQNEITVMMETELPFSGNVYAKGFFHKEVCRVHGDGVGNTVNITIPINADCGMRRKRIVDPKGVSLETTVVLMFHKLFLTKTDKAFHIECIYQESNEVYTQELDVSMIPTTDIVSESDSETIHPKCKYEVLENDEHGDPLSFAVIGQPVYHKWSCDQADPKRNTHCLTVHSCSVDDGQGIKQMLLDERGCPVDSILLDEIDYKGDLEAGRESFVFKFADKPTIFFSCQLRVEAKEDSSGKCKKRPKKKKKIEPDFPRPSTPLFESTTTPSGEDIIDEPDDEDDNVPPPPITHNSSEDFLKSREEEEEPTTTPESSTVFIKRRKKIRRPPKRAADDGLIALPEFVALQQDLGLRKKAQDTVNHGTVNMDVTAGAVDVIDMPEIPVNYRPTNPQFDQYPPPSTFSRDLNSKNIICVSKSLLVTILFGCIFFVLTCISAIVFLFWRFTKADKRGKGSITTTTPSGTRPSTAAHSILAFNQN